MVSEVDPADRASWPPFVDAGDIDLLERRVSQVANDEPDRRLFQRFLSRAIDDATELEILYGELPGVLEGSAGSEEHFRRILEDAAGRRAGATFGANLRDTPWPVEPSPFTPNPHPPQLPCQPRFLVQPFIVAAIVEGVDRISAGNKAEFERYARVVAGLWRQTDDLERLYRMAFEGPRAGRDRLDDTLRLFKRDLAPMSQASLPGPGDGAEAEPIAPGVRGELSDRDDFVRTRFPIGDGEAPPIIWPPLRGGVGLPRDPCELVLDACRTMVLGGASRLTLPLPVSTHADGIAAIVPASACPGDTIHIYGRGFGRSQPADVTVLISSLPARVVSWSEREIEVVVPEGASSGCVGFRNERLEAQRRELHEQNQRAREEISEGLACLRRGAIWPRMKYTASTVPCTGTNYFAGSLPEIEVFQINARSELTVRPGTALVLTWSVRNAAELRIRRTSAEGPAVDLTDPRADIWNLGPFTGNRAATATYELLATNACGTARESVTVHLRAALRITRVEVTQSIQTDDNLLPLVPGKATAVRVFLQSEDGDWEGVSATLTVGATGALSPANGPTVTAKAGGSDPRTLDDSFLFRLADRDVIPGQRLLEARLFSGPVSEAAAATQALFVSFSEVEIEAHVYGVTMGYRDVSRSAQRDFGLTSSDWPAKDFSAFEPQRQLTEAMFPVSKFEVLKLPGDPQPEIFDYADGDGYLEGRAWGHRLIDMNFPEGGERIYVLQPEEKAAEYHGNTEDSANGNIVMNGWDTPDDRGATFAHELGHSWTLNHVGINPGTNDPFDPNTDFPYRDGWMGPHVGVRFVPDLELLPSDESDGSHVRYDIMTYETPQWIAPFHYCKLMKEMSGGSLSCPASSRMFSLRRQRSLNVPRKDSRPLNGIKLVKGAKERRFLYVLGRIDADGRATFEPFEVITTTDDIESRPKGNEYQVVLEDDAGEVFATYNFDRPITTAAPPERTSIFSLFVAYDTTAARITLRRGSEILAERQPSKISPRVRLRPIPRGRVMSGKQRISWEASDPEGAQLTFSLWYSPDAGETFLPLNTGLKGTSALVDFDEAPASDRALLKICASNGVNTTEARSSRITVKRQ